MTKQSNEVKSAIEAARKEWPPLFAATELDRISGGALRRRTLANMRSLGEVPDHIFLRDGKKLLMVRDELLTWWSDRLKSQSELRGGKNSQAATAQKPVLAAKINDQNGGY